MRPCIGYRILETFQSYKEIHRPTDHIQIKIFIYLTYIIFNIKLINLEKYMDYE